ncbi:MAG: hydrogenase maturation protease [Pseudomonadota bacterium]
MNYIIGLGNILRSDDGIAINIIDYIIKNQLEQGFYALDFATNAWGLLPLLKTATKKILIIDCAKMQQQAGTVQFFDLNYILHQDKTTIENHNSSIKQILEIAQQADFFIPTINIMGIEPKSLKFNVGLSASLEEKLTEYSQQAISFIQNSTR